MHISTRKRIKETELNMTPMIDVVFLLITFFMLVSEITRQDEVEDLQLPDIAKAQPDERPDPKRLVINVAVESQMRKDRNTGEPIRVITRTGVVIISGRHYNLYKREDAQKIKDLLVLEARMSRDNPAKSVERIVLVKADRQAPFKDIKKIITMCVDSEVGIWKLAFGTKPLSPQERRRQEREEH